MTLKSHRDVPNGCPKKQAASTYKRVINKRFWNFTFPQWRRSCFLLFWIVTSGGNDKDYIVLVVSLLLPTTAKVMFSQLFVSFTAASFSKRWRKKIWKNTYEMFRVVQTWYHEHLGICCDDLFTFWIKYFSFCFMDAFLLWTLLNTWERNFIKFSNSIGHDTRKNLEYFGNDLHVLVVVVCLCVCVWWGSVRRVCWQYYGELRNYVNGISWHF